MIVVDVKHCARCWNDHDKLEFREMLHPTSDGFTHWALCPIVGHPVLLKVTIT